MLCWWRGAVTVALLFGGGHFVASEAPAFDPRYVLCPRSRPPSVRVGNADLRVFAASVASNSGDDRVRLGRPAAPIALRAAVLFDDPSAWRTELPTFQDRPASAGHSGSVSYAKCIGAMLPDDTLVGCRLGSGGGSRRPSQTVNVTDFQQFGDGRVVHFRNKELEQDFVDCVLGAQALRWRRRVGPPATLHVQLLFRFAGGSVKTVPLEMCRVDEPVKLLSFCSQPLYGLARIQREIRYSITDWLEYHLEYVGFMRGDIYDIDGSFEQVLGRSGLDRYLRSGRLGYHPRFAGNLSSSFEAFSKDHPYCAETWAYAHCLTTHRALSRHLLLLHAPDEYLVSRRRPEEWGPLKVVLDYERSMIVDQPVSMLRVLASSFARDARGPGSAAAMHAPGAVISTSPLRSALRYLHTPMLDPFLCVCAGPHTCYSEAEAEFPGMTAEVEPDDLVVHHYVEMLAGNVGRCAQQHARCDVPDESASHVVDWLHRRYPGSAR